MQEVILVRFGEIFLKGKNYAFFENTLLNNIKYKLLKYNCKLKNIFGRYIISNFQIEKKEEIIEELKTIFGIVSISNAYQIESKLDSIIESCSKIKITQPTFKVEVNRADKTFPIKSFELASKLGGVILKNNNTKVDVHNPKQVVYVDIRHDKKTYIFYDKITCLGGMPVGTAGKGMLLLSGGIDSPVAGFLMAKRGLKLCAVHFHSYPYTSLQAKQKVIDLANIIKKYTGDIKLFVVPFTKIQEEIHKNCSSEYMVTHVRRFMMEIAARLAKRNKCSCLITGENLAQVASQTVESITVTNMMAQNIPVFRPLISFDKIEISTIAEKIGTFQTSVLPYEDCCSVFLPKNPVTHPKLDKILQDETKLDREGLIKSAIENVEIISIKNN